MVCLFPQNTLGSCCDDDEEKEEEQRYGMPGLTPASEQSFDFDDHAYAAAPGSHGGSVDGENAFVPPRCVFFVVLFFLYDKTRARGRCISSFWRRRVREGEDREPATRTTRRRSFARILRATRAEKRQMQLESRSSSFFLYLRFCRAFFCVCARDERLETSKKSADADAGMRSLFSTARKTGTGRLANTTINQARERRDISIFLRTIIRFTWKRRSRFFELVFCSSSRETARSLPSARFRE